MACTVDRLTLEWMLVAAIATGVVFIPAGPWVSAAGVTSAKGWGEMRGKNGNIGVTPAVQFTNDVHDPGASNVTAVGTQMTTDNVSDPNGNTALASGSFRFVRPGWNVALSAGAVLATAAVGGTIELIRS